MKITLKRGVANAMGAGLLGVPEKAGERSFVLALIHVEHLIRAGLIFKIEVAV
jgi:hypothetical protein